MKFDSAVLKKSIVSLLKLQEIDELLFKINDEEKRPPKDYNEAKSSMAEAQKALRVVERSHRTVERERRSFELRLITCEEDLKRAESKRRDVRNTKEEFAASKEFESFQKKVTDTRTSLEEKTKAVAEKLAIVDEKKKAFEEVESKYKEAEGARDGRLQELKTEREKLEAQREAHIANVDKVIFSMYERVQRIRKGSGVAVVEGLVCAGCHVSIPPHMRNQLETMTEILTCPSCSRILYPSGEQIEGDESAPKAEAQ